MHPNKTIHIPVLLRHVLELAQPSAGESYLDMTAGYGGHAEAIIEATKAPTEAVLVDRDATAIASLQGFAERGALLIHQDYLSASRTLQAENRKFDIVLADLGVSSLHLDKTDRGFTFREAGPLDMRMDQRNELTADEIINTYTTAELVRILKSYGEEWRAEKVAAAIMDARPISDTKHLAEVVARAIPKKGKVHPATKTFQAVRIAVNDELGQLEQSLKIWLDLVKPGGRLLVISFHSLEDRLVKQTFAEVSGERYDADFRQLTRHAVTADDDELDINPRARSAKLRAVVKIKTKERG